MYWRMYNKLLYSCYNQTVMKYLLIINWPFLLMDFQTCCKDRMGVLCYGVTEFWFCSCELKCISLRILKVVRLQKPVTWNFFRCVFANKSSPTCHVTKLFRCSVMSIELHLDGVFLILSSETLTIFDVINCSTDLFASKIERPNKWEIEIKLN